MIDLVLLTKQRDEFEMSANALLRKAGLPTNEPILGRHARFFYVGRKDESQQVRSIINGIVIENEDILMELSLAEDSYGRTINCLEYDKEAGCWRLLIEKDDTDLDEQDEKDDKGFKRYYGLLTLEPLPKIATTPDLAQYRPSEPTNTLQTGRRLRYEEVPENVVFLLCSSSSSFSVEHYQRLNDDAISRVEFKNGQWTHTGFGEKLIGPKDLVEIVEVIS